MFTKNYETNEKKKPKQNIGELIRTANLKRILSGGESTDWSIKLYEYTEIVNDTIPSYRINYLQEK